MIKKLVLKNYRVHRDLTMDFGNLEIIKGRNGSGKTSIVEAIAFALFGSTLQRGKAKEWITRGQQHGSVTLYIDDYIIRRSDTLAVVEDANGNVIARNNTGITEWVEKTYGLTAELYRTSFYIGQKDISAFAALSPMERTKRVEKLLRIDKLDEIKEVAKEKARAAQANLATYTAKLEEAVFDEAVINKLTEKLMALEKEFYKEKDIYEKLLIKQGEYRQLLALWRTKQAAMEKFKGKLYDLEALEKENEEILKHNSNVEAVNKLVREKAILEKKLRSVIVLEKYFKCDIREIMNHETHLKNYYTLDNKVKELLKQGAEPKYYDLDKLERELDELVKIYKLNKSIPDVCPTCGQDWPEKPSIDLVQLKSKIDILSKEIEKKRLDTQLYNLSKQIEELGEPAMTKAEIDEAIQSIQNKEAYLRLKELNDVPNELQQFKKMEIDIKYAREQNNLAAKLDELRDVEEPEEVDIAPVKNRIEELEQAIKAVGKNLREQEKARAIYNEYSDLRESAEAKLEHLKKFIKFIDSYRKSFGNNVIPLLEENVSKIVAYLSEDKYESVTINPDYSVKDFDFFSGSEQDSVSFALRLAIAQVSRLGNFKTMLLDEIAASFDDQREQRLMDILKQQPNQLIYITHGDI